VVAVLVVLGAALLVVHLPPVQRAAWNAATRTIQERAGWRLRADHVRFRVWPARLELDGVEAGPVGGETVLTADRVTAAWRWLRLIGPRHRLERLGIDGLALDLAAAAAVGGVGGEGRETGTSLEVGRLEIRGGAAGPAGPVLVAVQEAVIEGSLREGSAQIAAKGRVRLGRDGRDLDLGTVDLAGAFGAPGAVVERFELDGTPLAIEASGRMVAPWDAPSGSFRFHGTIRPGPILTFLDPVLAARVAAQGALRLEGTAFLEDGAPRVRLDGAGEGLGLVGLGLGSVGLRYEDGVLHMRAAGGGWGQVTARIDPAGTARAECRLTGFPVRAAAAWLPELPVAFPADAVVDGTLRAGVAFGGGGARLLGAGADAAFAWSGGRAEVDAALDGDALRVRTARVVLPGASAEVSGAAWPRLDLAVHARATDLGAAAREAARWGAPLPAVSLPAGTVRLDGRITGRPRRPVLDLELDAGPLAVDRIASAWARVCLRGPLDALDVAASASLPGGGTVTGRGAVDVPDAVAVLHWTAISTVEDLVEAFAGATIPAEGMITAGGSASYGDGVWRVTADARMKDGRIGGVPVRTFHLACLADLSGLTVGVRAASGAGRLELAGTIGGWGPEAPLILRAEAMDLRPDLVEQGPWHALHGSVRFAAGVGGTLGDPRLTGTVSWRPDQAGEALGTAEAGIEIRDGLATVDAPRIVTAAGPLAVHLTVPLGGLPRPSWLWPGASDGPVRVYLSGCSLESGPLLAALGRPALPVSVRADVEADLEVDPAAVSTVKGLVVLRNLVIDSEYARMRAARDVVVRADEGRFELERTWIGGDAGTLVAEGWADIGAGRVELDADGKLGAPLLEMLLPMARVEGGLGVHLRVAGPLGGISGEVEVEQGDGLIVLTDPPVELRGIHAALVLEDGLVEVPDGSATVNGGHVELGGGWDPASGQGIVAELEHVAFVVPPGIVTRWDGLLALEPGEDGRVRLAGDLELVRGVWDTPFDLLQLASGGVALPTGVDDPLDRIDLQMEVRGRNGILVENNLGTFQLAWRRLEVEGTLARPMISGSLELIPGGRIRVGGRTTAIVRGRIELPGGAGEEPEVTLVVRDTRSLSAGLETLDLADIVQAGAAASMGRLFGFESTAIDPVEVAAETETDPARRLTLGRRFGKHLSYFFTTNLADTQDTTQIVQVGEMGIPGLYGQWISSSTESDGWAVLERMRWGGSPDEEDAGERIRKIRLEGEWPLSKWTVRARLGLFAGQRWEPFMAFASRVRLERELAGYGYPDARVTVEVTGPPEKRVVTFRCQAGDRVVVRWEGRRPDKATRRSVVALWTPALPDTVSFQAMREAVRRWFAAHGWPDARVTVSREDGEIVIRTERGKRLELMGLEISGLHPDVARGVARWWTAPADLAALLAGREEALARLRATLAGEGRPGARIRDVELVRDGKHEGRVRVTVDPGPEVLVREVRLVGEDPLGVVGSPDFALRPGACLCRRALSAARRTLLERYREAGYIDVQVRIRRPSGPDDGTVTIELEPGVQRVVGTIRFRGARQTRESVLRKGVVLRTGEPLRESALDESMARIGAFPPVSRVTARTETRDGGMTDVLIDLRERPRWTAGTGVRWSSDRGSQLLLELDDENLFGRGVSARFRMRWGSKDRLGQLLFGLPPAPGGRFHLAFSTTFTHTERGSRIERTGLFSLEGWLERGGRDEIRIYLQRERSHLYEKDPDPFFPLDLTVTVASLGGQLILDRRDDLLDPRHGWFLSVDGSYSGGLLGSDLRAARTMTTFSLATEPRRRWTAALGVRLGAARALRGVLDPTHRFYAGGEWSIRGFERDWVGPVGCFFGRCSPAGGGALLVLNNEIRFPITGTLRGVVFLDAGQVWERWSDADLRLSTGAGIGIRWGTPLGPLRLDLAIPVAHKGISSGLHVYFGIGQVF